METSNRQNLDKSDIWKGYCFTDDPMLRTMIIVHAWNSHGAKQSFIIPNNPRYLSNSLLQYIAQMSTGGPDEFMFNMLNIELAAEMQQI